MLRFILGSPGSGKSFLCASEIIEAQEEGATALVYIVPEQFSLSSERMLLDRSAGKGLFAAQVLSFNRLAYSVLREVGRGGLVPLDEVGKHILVRKALLGLSKRLRYYKSAKTLASKGFVQKISQIITEFHQYGITPSALAHAAGKMEDGSPRSLRLADLADVFKAYLELVNTRYNTGDTTLNMLAERCSDSRKLRGARIWIDGFKSFTPQEYSVIAALARSCERITIALPMDGELDSLRFTGSFDAINTFEPYAEVKGTVNRLSRIAVENGASIGEHAFLGHSKRQEGFPALRFLLKQYFDMNSSYEGRTDGIVAVKHKDIHDEIEYTARRVVRLVREHGYRYADIGVIASDLGLYAAEMEIVFARHDIPLFIDERRGILAHPLAEVCRAALAVAAGGYTYEHVFRALKTGLLPITARETDVLENYVLACGIKGRNWEKEWHWEPDGDAEQVLFVNKVRVRVCEVFRHIRGGKRTAREMCERLYHFLIQAGVKGRLEEWITEAREQGEPELAGIHAQMWARLTEILDVVAELFGETVCGQGEFAELLEAGLESTSAGLAPPTLDHITAGDIRRSRLTGVKALFVLGLNEKLIPARMEEGIIPDADREALKQAGITLAGTLKQRALDDRLNILQVLAKPSELLYLSYLDNDEYGAVSPVLGDIRRKFPNMRAEDGDKPEVVSAKAMLNLCAVYNNEESACGELTRATLLLKERYPPAAELMQRLNGLRKDAGASEARLMDNDITELFGAADGKLRVRASVSRLENYRQCPFMYFAKSCLNLRERKLHEIENTDVGNVLHLALDKFTRGLQESGSAVPYERLKTAVSGIVEEAAAECANAILLSGERYGYFKNRVNDTALRTIEVMTEHLARSGFRVYAAEAEFGAKTPVELRLDENSVIQLNGRIDRVDIMERAGKRFISIIDYKTGSRAFSFADVWLGLQLQLVVYLWAYLAENPGAVPAGAMYFRVANPVAEFQRGMDADEANLQIFGKFRMSGVTSSNTEIILAMDNAAQNGDMLPVTLIGGGKEVSKRSAALDEAGFNALLELAAQRVREIGAGILSGHVPAKPLKYKQRLACGLCGYNAVCGRGVHGAFRPVKRLSEKEAIENILTSGR